jgi:hypothetical protein
VAAARTRFGHGHSGRVPALDRGRCVGALRLEHDAGTARFEEASMLLSRAIKTIRKSLDCSSADAAILAKEVGRVTRELKTGARR